MRNITNRLRVIPAAFLALSFIFLTGLTIEERKDLQTSSQPSEERAAQDNLPQAQDKIWSDFAKCKVNIIEDTKNDVYNYGINYTPEVKAMAGKEITVDGFMLPLEAKEKFQHFILSKRTPTCAFCPPGAPNEIVDVWTNKPVEWSEFAVSVTGKFSLMEDKKLGMFFKLSDAKVFAPQPHKAKARFW